MSTTTVSFGQSPAISSTLFTRRTPGIVRFTQSQHRKCTDNFYVKSLRLKGGHSSAEDSSADAHPSDCEHRASTQRSIDGFLAGYGVIGRLLTLRVIYSADTGSVGIGLSQSQGSYNSEYQFHCSDHFLQRQPVVDWDKTLGPCTLMLIDPDAPFPKGDGTKPGALAPWLHWLVVDAITQPEAGRCVVEHMGPCPPAGAHRYIFLLFQQRAVGVEVAVPSLCRERWDLGEFLRANPSLLPVASNFFCVESG